MAAVSGPGRGHVRLGRRHGARRCCVRRRGSLLRWAQRTLLGFALEDGGRGQNAGLRSRTGAAAAPRTPVVVFLPPAAAAAATALPLLSRLEGPPSIVGSLSLSRSFSFSFSPACSRRLPPLVTPAPLSTASNCLDARPSTGRDRLLGPSELAGASTGAGAGLGADAAAEAGAPAPASVAGLEEAAADAA